MVPLTILRVCNLHKSFGERTILSDVSLEIGVQERIGLVGVNGTGKTTLANILFGNLQSDEGSIIQMKQDLKIGYLLQSCSYTVNSFQSILLDGNNAEQVDKFLEVTSFIGLNKVQEWREDRFDGLSGGERTKLALANIWISQPDFLILDEPTNHLDFQGVEWLTEEMGKFSGTILVISHDRYFLDKTVNRIIELDDGKLKSYAGNYSFYREEKERQYQSQLHLYQTQKKQSEKVQAEIAQLKTWTAAGHRQAGKQGSLSENRQIGLREHDRAKVKKLDKQVKNKLKRLERMITEGVEKPKQEQKVSFDFGSASKRGKRLAEAKGLGKKYGERWLFRNTEFAIQRGNRIGLIGPNGCGKTTLIRMLLDQERWTEGDLWISPTAEVVYLSQDVTDLPEESTGLNLISHFRGEIQSKARILMHNMGLDEAKLSREIKKWSLGERTRFKIGRMILMEHNFLILDEPTNHLDLQSREQLEDTLADYNGTMLIVSHDRYMLEKLCDQLLVFENGKFKQVLGTFSEYMNRQLSEGNGSNEKVPSKKSRVEEEQLLVIETRLSLVLGDLTKHEIGSPAYNELDNEFKDLIRQKRELLK
ncbi:ribosomal protection-like ABC-F family protein [Brevibacillus sp. DP1.3A]|uniref:ribosomal protection-like ABC-F family protein n=1 Tax=Brevibacillus sp. DP1.3A TaxID=2738867 RepID=UPI001D1639FC|nr:ABC-F family ATP-binding cassette domain-containing protein [Brevibacillus sp. DP1.3A]UED72191.1 ATP-binding cassette domain-containing protein [Brevibacillus sp. DP1.3A]